MNFDIYPNAVYIIFFICVYAFNIYGRSIKLSRKQFCIVLGLLLVCGLLFRDYNQGLNDTRDTYLGLYNLTKELSWVDLYDSIYCQFTSPLFVTLIKVFADVFGFNFRVFIFICAGVFVYAYQKLIYKHCDNVALAEVLFISFIYPYGFFLMRQCLAMGFVALALCAWMDNSTAVSITKKYTKTIIFTLFAASIHSISLVFFLVWFLGNIIIKLLKIDYKLLTVILVALIALVSFAPGKLQMFLNYLPQTSKYSILLQSKVYHEGDLWVGLLIIYSLLFIEAVIGYKKTEVQDKELHLLCAGMSVFFVGSTALVQDMVRIAYYFFISIIYLMCNKESGSMLKVSDDHYSLLNWGTLFGCSLYAFIVVLPSNNIIFWR